MRPDRRRAIKGVMRGFWPLPLALLSGLAQAQGAGGCNEAVEDAMRAFGGSVPIEGTVVAADCKTWPPSAGTILAAVMAFRIDQPDERKQDWNVPGVVALVDARTGKVLHGYRFTVGEDTTTRVAADSLVLDTADFVWPLAREHLACAFTTPVDDPVPPTAGGATN